MVRAIEQLSAWKQPSKGVAPELPANLGNTQE
jgi:hypothetical protein